MSETNPKPPINLYKALLKAQSEFGPFKKTKKVNIPKFNMTYSYAELSDILEIASPILWKNNILFTSISTDTHVIVKLIHTETGEEMSNPVKIKNDFDLNQLQTVIDSIKDVNTQTLGTLIKVLTEIDMQKNGGAITFARRYGLVQLLGISTEDDTDCAEQKVKILEREQTARNTVTDAFKNKYDIPVKPFVQTLPNVKPLSAKTLSINHITKTKLITELEDVWTDRVVEAFEKNAEVAGKIKKALENECKEHDEEQIKSMKKWLLALTKPVTDEEAFAVT